MFSLIAFQDELIERLAGIHYNGVGEHKHRSRRAACRDAREQLARRGYTPEQADYAVRQAVDMSELIIHCD